MKRILALAIPLVLATACSQERDIGTVTDIKTADVAGQTVEDVLSLLHGGFDEGAMITDPACLAYTETVTSLCGEPWLSASDATWTACGLSDGGSTTGDFGYASTFALSPAGATCETADGIDLDETITFNTVDVLGTGETIEIHDSFATSGNLPFYDWDFGLTVIGTSTEKVTDSGGTVLEDLAVEINETISYSATESTLTATIGGSLGIDFVAENQSFDITIEDLFFTAGYDYGSGCCHPVGGGLKIEEVGTGATSTVTYGPACGDATLDGAPYALPSCY